MKFENSVLIIDLKCVKYLDLKPRAYLSSHICTLNLIFSIKYNLDERNTALVTSEMIGYLRLISLLTEL